jgi:hypothetical protein
MERPTRTDVREPDGRGLRAVAVADEHERAGHSGRDDPVDHGIEVRRMAAAAAAREQQNEDG